MLTRIATAFYTEPWLIREDVHRDLGQVLQSRLQSGDILTPLHTELHRTDGALHLVAPRYANSKQPDAPPGMMIEDGIALGTVRGIMGKHLSLMEMLCAGGYDTALLEQQCLELQGRDDVHTVVYVFDTPGGRAVGAPEAASLVADLAGTGKRVCAFLDMEACSAGYWVASACDVIAATPSSIVGSIGAYSAFLDRTRQLELEGLKLEVFSDGQYKGMGLPGTALSAEQRKFFSDRTQRIGDQFKSWVTEHRPQVNKEILNGMFMSADDGLSHGLVDEIHLTLDHFLSTLL